VNDSELFADLFAEGDLLPAPAPPAVEPIPQNRAELLAVVGPERRRIYDTVRSLLDELETAVPWSALYYPPDDVAEFMNLESRLLGVIESSPARIRDLLESLRQEATDLSSRQTIDDIEFYFAGIHEMASHDLAKLRARLKPFSDAVAAVVLTAPQRDALCEHTADLKGKYASAIMGATASILAEGHWTGVEIEPILFAEKAEEFERNRTLLDNLRTTVQAVREIGQEVAFGELRRRWLLAQRVDQYALADLPTFRGRLGRLLKQPSRRALYSGDYRQIQRRERRLSARINELEELHHLTWSATPGQSAEAMAQVFERLAQLILEIAAIIDVELLATLVGDKPLQTLRAIAVAEKEEDRRQPRDADATDVQPAAQVQLRRRRHPRREGLSDEQHALIPLLHEEDLRTFFDLLLGSVAKRASLALRNERTGAAPRVGSTASMPSPLPVTSVPPPTALRRPPTARTSGSFASLLDADEPAPHLSTPPVATPKPTSVARAAAPPPPRASWPERVAAARLIHDEIAGLRTNGSSSWISFRMIQRLVAKQTGVPPSMLQAAHPFLRELQSRLLPRLPAAIAMGDLSPDIGKTLAQICDLLLDQNLGPRQIRDDVPEAINRLLRVLDGLEASTAAILVSALS
jgi:hypothetical protein